MSFQKAWQEMRDALLRSFLLPKYVTHPELAVDITQLAEYRGLLKAIIDDPDSDNLRRIFADWLEEHGDGARAEYIRVQCEIDTLKKALDGCFCDDGSILLECDTCGVHRTRYQTLLQREAELQRVTPLHQWRQWCHPPVELRNATWSMRRGFVSEITLPGDDWLTHARKLVMEVPLRRVRLASWPQISLCARSPELPDPAPSPLRPTIVEFPGYDASTGITSEMCARWSWVQMRPVVAGKLLYALWPRIDFVLPGED